VCVCVCVCVFSFSKGDVFLCKILLPTQTEPFTISRLLV
jgi:hypothetical protein